MPQDPNISESNGRRFQSALPLFESPSTNGFPSRESAHARRSDPETSHKAAASVSLVNLGRTKERILSILRTQGPMTDEQIAAYFERFVAFKVSPSGLRTRRSWLVDHGLVKAAGEGKTQAGRACTIWSIA